MDSTSPDTNRAAGRSLFVWLTLAAGALALWGILTFRHKEPTVPTAGRGAKSVAVGTRPGELRLEPLADGRRTESLESLEGQVVLINLWATWCGPCRREMPHLWQLSRSLPKGAPFRLLSVVYDRSPDDDPARLRGEARHIFQQLGVEFDLYVDPGHTTRRGIVASVQKDVYPTTVLLDRQGVIRGAWTGYGPSDTDEMRRLVEELLKR